VPLEINRERSLIIPGATINPNDALAYYNRATAKAQLGNPQDAIADFQKAADLGKQQDNQRLYQDALDRNQRFATISSRSPNSLISIWCDPLQKFLFSNKYF
jgi:tetratricopeptide (TPR) repeat protein